MSAAGDRERRAVAFNAARHLQAAIDDVRDAAAEVERATGHRVLRDAPSIAGACRADLDRMTNQCAAWLAAMAVVDRWMLPTKDSRSLGDLAKVLPSDELAELRYYLAAAGLGLGT